MASAIGRGVVLAIVAAVAFGVTTPAVAWAGHAAGPLATAALLYAGAAGAAIAMRWFGARDGGLRRSDLPRLGLVALCGAAIAPALLAWGLQRTGATIGALLLNLEAVFTVLLARAVYREPIGVRVGVAVTTIAAGGALLVLAARGDAAWSLAGVLAVAGATLGWALDNTLTRPLAERDPLVVVAGKGGLGAALTLVAAVLAGEAVPPARETLVLLACGATGYGASLRLYLLAQRRIGTARTGSVFAIAPFVGAAVAVAAGERALDGWTLVAAGMFAAGVLLHITEHHGHHHIHEAVQHEHPHRHDDGHHDHAHDPPVAGEHSHIHSHARLEHTHDHAPDLHHDHVH